MLTGALTAKKWRKKHSTITQLFLKIGLDFGVKGLPTTWFIEGDGERISNLPGFIAADILLNILKYINTDSFKEMPFRKFMEL